MRKSVHRTGGAGRRLTTDRGGSVLVYTVIMFTVLSGIVSLAVDYGHVQQVKAEEQRAADAAARAYIQLNITYGSPTGYYYAPYIAQAPYNSVDGNSGVNPTVTVIPGGWDQVAKVFYPGSSSYCQAVQVTVSRTAAANNAVPLYWGALIGKRNIDVSATAIAALVGGQSGNVNFNAIASPYMAGMPNGTVSSWGDTPSNATAYQVNSIPVVPGTLISFSNVSGTTSIVPGTVAYSDANGDPGRPLHHGENWNGNPNNPGPENGIADAVMPADAMMGLFLTDNAPNTQTAPATVDWTTAAMNAQTSFTNIQNQQPFMIGKGTTSGGATRTFLVPAGATRLYLGIWDGVQYDNNAGSLSGTIGVQQSIMMVK